MIPSSPSVLSCNAAFSHCQQHDPLAECEKRWAPFCSPVLWSQNCMTSSINWSKRKHCMFVLLAFSRIHELTWLSTGKTGVSERKQAGKHNTVEEGNKGGNNWVRCTHPQSSFTWWFSLKSSYDISSNHTKSKTESITFFIAVTSTMTVL